MLERAHFVLVLWFIYLITGLFGHKSVLRLGRISINSICILVMLVVKKFWPDNLWYVQPFHMIFIAAWNIYFIKDVVDEVTLTNSPVEMFGAD